MKSRLFVALAVFALIGSGTAAATVPAQRASSSGVRAAAPGPYVAAMASTGVLAAAGDPVSAVPAGSASVIEVPADQPPVQAAIDAADDGDLVLLAPGVYVESLVVADKAVTIASYAYTTGDLSYVDQTIIDGNDAYDIVSIGPNIDGRNSIIGITVRNGVNGITSSSPVSVLFGRVTDTSDAIDVEEGALDTIIRGSLVDNNKDDAVDFDGTSDGLVEHNVLVDNEDDGIEIRLPAEIAATPSRYVIRNNVISRNLEDGIQMIGNASGFSNRETLVEGNLFEDNTEAAFSMMCCSLTSEDQQGAALPEHYVIANNTFRGNALGVIGGDNVVAVNNVFVGHDVAVKRLQVDSVSAHNLFFGNSVDHLDAITLPTNIVADPLLALDGSLPPGSPAIDAGVAHFSWNGRTILDVGAGDFTGSAPDLGAFEVGGDDPLNQPPFVTAGLHQQIESPGTAQLVGVVSDDGIPGAAPSTSWIDVDDTGNVTFADETSPTTTATFAEMGLYTLELQASDGPATSAARVTVQVGEPPVQPETIDLRIASGADDAEEQLSNGAVTLVSADLDLGGDGGRPHIVGLRFPGLAIPPGATIESAHLQFEADEVKTDPASFVVEGEATPNPAPFAAVAHDLTGRAKTSSSVAWPVPAWNYIGEAGPDQRTPDIAPVIQEITDGPGWLEGNPLHLFVSGTGERAAESYEGGVARAPVLHVAYTIEPSPLPVVIRPFGVIVAEGDTGQQTANAIVYLQDANGDPYAAPNPVSVDWTTVEISGNPKVAQPGSDFVAASGTLTIPAGQSQATVPVEILGNTVAEPPLLYGEWLLLWFSNPSPNATIWPGFYQFGLVIIADDD